jgi:hypothetical protein
VQAGPGAGGFSKKLTACLGFWADWKAALLVDEDHKHGAGEDRAKCANCRLAEFEAAMSPFEAGCLRWYLETVTEFSMEAGIVAESFRALRLRGNVLRIFTIAVNKIHSMMEAIRGTGTATEPGNG